MKQAVILVGGQGTRLGTLTRDTPKPLLNVAGRPFLDTLILNIARFGMRDIVLLAGYLGEQVVRRYESWGTENGLTVRCVVEPEAAGTGGALHYARDVLDEEFFLCNGDTFFDLNFLDLLLIPTADNWTVKLALRHVEEAGRFGAVVLDGERVVELREKGGAGPGLINGGVYLVRREILDWVGTLPCSIERDVFPKLAGRGLLYGREYRGFFIDIGIPADLEAAQKSLPTQIRRPAVFLDRDGVLNEDLNYVCRKENFVWIAGAIEAVKALNDSGHYVFVVTNQAGIARNYYTEETMHALHAWMADELQKQGAHVDAIYYCPHHPEGVVAAYTGSCGCRKPAPGMIERAMREWPVEAGSSVLIGDKEHDIKAAVAAGIRGALFDGRNLRHFLNTITG